MRRPSIPKLAGLGALAAAGGILAIYLLLVYITIPRATGGIDITNALLTWISVGAIVLALIVPHVIYGRMLMSMGAREEPR